MNLTDVFMQEGKVKEIKCSLEDEVSFEKKWIGNPVIELQFSHLEKGKLLVKGRGEAAFYLSCDRCLEMVEERVSLDFERELFSPEIPVDEDTAQEQYYLEGYELNTGLLLQEILHINWPTKILCRQDCKGICKKCGQNLNQAACQCDDFVPDVRWANLMDIFSNVQP